MGAFLFTHMNENPTLKSIKLWIFPTLASLVGLLIWSDVNEIKGDVKALMAQSNIDKTRIDNLERVVYKTAASSPTIPSIPLVFKDVAVLPNNKLIIRNEKVLF